MKSLMLLWNSIAATLAVRCCTSAHRDIQTVSLRSKNEGFSFLTITLPNFGKDFELSLDRGYVDNTVFCSFSKHGSLPRFLSGFSCLVFDRSTGVLLDNPDIQAIQAIRQLTLFYSKIELECKASRIRDAFRGYVKCEQEVEDLSPMLDHRSFHRISTLLFGRMLTKVDKLIYDGRISPKHGPGATADRLVGNQKYAHKTWPVRLERYFPFVEMALPNHSFWEELERVNFLEPDAEIPVKVITVPKTMKTPRIIAVEPTAMQYAQQGLLRLIQDGIKMSYLDSFIGLDNQKPNQLMACQGSSQLDLATLDLSEASDRVSCELVSTLLSNHQHLHDAVMDCRSRKALLPSGEILTLRKFASMGSALCFPMEAMVFLTIVFLGIESDLERQLALKDIKSYKGRVRVYGDDIIVPVEHVRSVTRLLSSFGMKVNVNKSFWTGKFRESCGKEYYDGRDVSIVRCRQVLPSSRKNAREIVSTVSLRNQLFWASLGVAVDLLDCKMFKLLKHFPIVAEGSPVLGRHTCDSLSLSENIGVSTAPKVKGWMIRSLIPKNEINDWPALRKSLQKLEERGPLNLLDIEDSEPLHLQRSGRPRVVDIKLGVGPSGF